MTARSVCSWSGGKDAAFALLACRRDPTVSVERLYTTTSAGTDRVTMHGVRPTLIQRQADRLALPLDLVELPADPSNEAYERVVREHLADYADRGVERLVVADLFLADVRAYRESTLDGTGLSGYWPLWERPTDEVAEAFVDAGFRATVVCVDGSALDRSFVGREYDRAFLADLPADVDPCGEHGEFHTFVHDGPGFSAPVRTTAGERVTRSVQGTDFHYCDLLADG